MRRQTHSNRLQSLARDRAGNTGRLSTDIHTTGGGYVQLTWLRNYEVMSERLTTAGIANDLVNDPDEAMQPEKALMIMFIGMHEGLFTGKKLSTYFNEWTEDAVHARKIINGLDKAKMIAGYYYEFNSALKAARNV